MDSIFELILVLVIIINQMLLGSSRIGFCINLIAAQGMALSLMPLTVSNLHITWHLLFLAVAVFLLKGALFPRLLLRSLKIANVRREVEPFVGFTASVVFGILILAASLWLASGLKLPGQAVTGMALPAALYTIGVGLFLIVCRRKALMQVIGYMALENGTFIFGVTVARETPLLVEMGVLLDVFAAVFVMGIASYHISQEFGSADVAQLNNLKG